MSSGPARYEYVGLSILTLHVLMESRECPCHIRLCMPCRQMTEHQILFKRQEAVPEDIDQYRLLDDAPHGLVGTWFHLRCL